MEVGGIERKHRMAEVDFERYEGMKQEDECIVSYGSCLLR